MTTATLARRGTSNSNQRGSSADRRRRREWLVETYRADVDVIRIHWASTNEWTESEWSDGLQRLADRWSRVAACRCYRCGQLLTVWTVTVDRIIPGCMGGTYRRNNIRPACGGCNSETGGALAALTKRRKK
jgi:hypothetical protein